MDDENNIVTLIDEETGEEIELALVDGFEYKDKFYSVLITLEENEDDVEMMIMEQVEDEAGEVYLSSVAEEEEDDIYDYYDQLCEESLDDEDESED